MEKIILLAPALFILGIVIYQMFLSRIAVGTRELRKMNKIMDNFNNGSIDSKTAKEKLVELNIKFEHDVRQTYLTILSAYERF